MKKEINLIELHACKDAIIFAELYNTPREAWDYCPRGDWMLWLASKLKVDERKLFLAKGRCAETVIHLMKDQRSKDAVQAAIDYGEGRIEKDQLKTAAYAAYSAYTAAYSAYTADTYDAYTAAYSAYTAAYSAYTAAYSAYTADTYDAYTAAYSAYTAASAYAATAYAAAARTKNRLQTANICREILTDEIFEEEVKDYDGGDDGEAWSGGFASNH